MWRVLVSSLLVGVAASQYQYPGPSGALNIASGYLPPVPGGANIRPNVQCAKPKTIYRTETKEVVKIVQKVVTVKVPQVIESTSVVQRVVPKTVSVTVVKEVKSPDVRVQVRTQYVDRVISRTVSVPGQIREVTQTKVEERVSYKTETRVVEKIKEVTETRVQSVPYVVRVTKTVERKVPQVVFVTKTVEVPGRNIVKTKVEQRDVVSVKKYQPPDQTRVQEKINYISATVTRGVPGPVINKVNNVVRTQVVERTSVKRVPQISTQIVQKNQEVVKTETKINEVKRVEVKTVEQVRNVPVVVTKTVEKIVPVPVLLTKTVTVDKEVPSPDVVRTVYRTDVSVQKVEGPERVSVSVRDVDSVVTKVVQKTIIKPNIVEKVVTRTEPCQGYRYDPPSNPLKF